MVTSQEASKLFEVKLDACETQEFSIVDEDEPSTQSSLRVPYGSLWVPHGSLRVPQSSLGFLEVKLDACETQQFSIIDEDEPTST